MTGSGMAGSSSRLESSRKPLKCPRCGHRPVAEILYGEPAFDVWLEQKINEGRITLGGCCVTPDDPAWKCARCGLRIYRSKNNST